MLFGEIARRPDDEAARRAASSFVRSRRRLPLMHASANLGAVPGSGGRVAGGFVSPGARTGQQGPRFVPFLADACTGGNSPQRSPQRQFFAAFSAARPQRVQDGRTGRNPRPRLSVSRPVGDCAGDAERSETPSAQVGMHAMHGHERNRLLASRGMHPVHETQPDAPFALVAMHLMHKPPSPSHATFNRLVAE